MLLLAKLAAIFATMALGYVAARQGWLDAGAGPGARESQARADARGAQTRADARNHAARVLGSVVFTIFVPALLFRTMARIDFALLPWHVLAAFLAPLLAFMLVVQRWQRRRTAGMGAAAAATRGVTASYGNTVQLGIPVAAALYGEAGLALHLAIVSLHGVALLTLATVLVELDIARDDHGATLASTLRTTVRQTLLHPVVLPVLLGLGWNLGGLGLHPLADELLASLGAAAVPLCLVLIGVSLAAYGFKAPWPAVLEVAVLKMLVLPALVLVTAHWGLGLTGMPLGVVVMMAALPTGSNALIFAQRYQVLEAEATASIVATTLLFVLSAGLWLWLLAHLGA
jgi:malonate transporter and related proteins